MHRPLVPAASAADVLAVILAAILAAAARPAHAGFFWANPSPTGAELGGVAFESATSGWAVGEFATTLRTTDGGATWEDLTVLDPASPDLNDVLIHGSGVLLAAGDAPGLHRSTDGGVTWIPLVNPAAAELASLFRLDADTIFSAGAGGRVIRSTDAGASWELLGAAGNDVTDQWWTDSTTAWVLGPALVRRTTDGGGTWTPVPGINDFASFLGGDVSFTDATNGWILRDFDTYRTTDGGATWTESGAAFPLGPIYQNEGVVLGPLTRLVATDGEGAEIWKTTDGGDTWSQRFNHPGTRGITDLQRLPGGALVAVSSDGDLLRSTDDGGTWANFTAVAGPDERDNLNALRVLPGGLGFAGGWNGAWLQTTDGGDSWFDPASDPGLDVIFALALRDPSLVLAGGSATGSPGVRRSTDGGATWTVHPLDTTNAGSPQGLAAFPDGTCWCVTYGGSSLNRVYRSTDHGVTWHRRDAGLSTPRLMDLFFLDPATGLVCGGEFGSPTLSRTTDGGASWIAIGGAGLHIGMIRDMHWFDVATGLVCGDSRVQRTTDGGATWSTPVLASGGYAMDFLSPSTGYVDAFLQGVRRTTDAGVTWTLIPTPMSNFVDDVLARPDGFLVAGLSNGIFGFKDDAPTGAPLAAAAAAAAVGAEGPAVWPNPVSLSGPREVAFRWAGHGGERVILRVVDVRGRNVHRAAVALDAAGAGRADLSRAPVAAGMAFLELRALDGSRAGAKVTFVQ